MREVDSEVHAGEILGLIGPNGAGKTTLVNVMTGFQRPASGRVKLGDVDVTGCPPARLARMGVARTFQGTRIFPRLTVLENVEAGAVGVGLDRKAARARAWELLERMDLSREADRWARTLSQGDERRVGVARAVASGPSFLLLDEPAAGLNDSETQRLMADLKAIREDLGCGVVVIEHDMAFIVGVCDRIHVLDRGATLAIGSPSEVESNSRVREAYLGPAQQNGTDRAGAAPVPERSAQAARATSNSERRSTRAAPGNERLLRVEDLTVTYGSVAALRGVTLEVARQEVVAVIGPNGAGKSTLLQAIAGSVRATSGGVWFDGEYVTEEKPEVRVDAGLALVPEGRRIFGDLTVEENLRLGATARRRSKGEARDGLEEVMTRFPVLSMRLGSLAGGLSGGEQQQLAIGRALMARPQLLLLDEPSLGLGPQVIATVFEALKELQSDGCTILLVEQFVSKALEVADRVYGLRNGLIEVQGAKNDVALSADVEGIYFGARSGA